MALSYITFSQVPLTIDGVPVVHKFVVGAVVLVVPFELPQTQSIIFLQTPHHFIRPSSVSHIPVQILGTEKAAFSL